MNLKYYLRGLGIGIIVTALIMGITLGGKEKLSNAEIIERAKALGMVEEGTLKESGASLQTDADAQKEQNPAASGTEAVSPEGTSPEDLSGENGQDPSVGDTDGEDAQSAENVSGEEGGSDGASEGREEAVAASNTPGGAADDPQGVPVLSEEVEPEDGVWKSDEERGTAGGSVTIQINRGDGSYSACKRLEEAGLVESASAFDNYLYKNGYDKKIRAGSFEIPTNAGPEKIARIISGME